jgi:hypothetical protein
MKRPAHPVCAASRWSGNLGSNSPWGTAARHGSARCSLPHSVPRRSWAATRPLAGLHYRFKITRNKIQKNARKDASPTRGFAASPGVGPGATIGTLKTRVPPHTSSKSRRRARRSLTYAHVSHDSSFLAQGSSGTAMCLMAPALNS